MLVAAVVPTALESLGRWRVPGTVKREFRAKVLG